ncbi:MAG: hypothetical protein J1F31_03350 [Erysipelotrichales bacterium]|nr:hypothetical protein [Erysipelotrichales bacterium]
MMRPILKLFVVTGALFCSSLLINNEVKVTSADEQSILKKEDFVFNFEHKGTYSKEYTLSLDFVSDDAQERYEEYSLIYDWNVLSIAEQKSDDNTFTFDDSMESDYVYTISVNVSVSEEDGKIDGTNSIKFTKYLQNGEEIFVYSHGNEENPEESFSLPYWYIPIIAAVLGIIYLISFKTNKLTGSLESTEEKLTVLLSYKRKFDKIIKNQKTKETKKKKQIAKLLFSMRGHLYSIRYIIENMSIDDNIDNAELLDECNEVINSINAIDMKKVNLDEAEKRITIIFERDLAHLASISKRMLNMQKKYVESTYGKK